MKKILFLIHDLGQGGAEKVLVNLVNNMDPNKFDISVTAIFGTYPLSECLQEDDPRQQSSDEAAQPQTAPSALREGAL